MRLRIVKREAGRLEMDFSGESHTLLNLLQSSLLRQEGVKMAGYSKPHPLMDRSTLYVDIEEGRQPEEALIAAAEDAKRLVNEFLSEFEREVEGLKKRE